MNVAEKLVSSPFALYVTVGVVTLMFKSQSTGRIFNEKFGERELERRRILASLRAQYFK